MNEYQILCEIRNLLLPLKDEYREVDWNTAPVRRIDDNPLLIASENPNRVELYLHNSSADPFYIGGADDIDTDRYVLRLAGYDTLVISAQNYKMMLKNNIYGFWEAGADAASTCMTTEFYLAS